MVVFPPETTVFDERPEHLFDEEGVPFGLTEDRPAQLRGQLRRRQHALREPVALVCGEVMKHEPSDVRALAERVRVSGPIGEEKEHPRGDDAVGQVEEELLRGLVDPVEVLHDQNEGPELMGSIETIVASRVVGLVPARLRETRLPTETR
jgi:hypothetical protein